MTNEGGDQVLREAIERVMRPLARLAMSRGLPYAQAEELLKRAFVQAARDARREAGAPAERDVSQVSVATGMSRRDVARVSAELQPASVQRPAPATELFSRWVSDRRLRGPDGRPRPLPRTGRAPSFESLARSVTRHVHPRSLLAELERLGLAEVSEDGATVRLLRDRFVPGADDARLLGFLGHNVADHLAAATANVVHQDRRHLEQAVFTDELSDVAADAVRDLAERQWRALMADVVPELERLIAEDKAQGRPPSRRARIGLYTFHEPLPEVPHDAQPTDP
jgi:hypothetical protein